MRQITCDLCGKEIIKGLDHGYSILDIEHDAPNLEISDKLFLDRDEPDPTGEGQWSFYYPLDFCAACWQGEDLAPLRRIVMKRLG
jgi:hypothetical protein